MGILYCFVNVILVTFYDVDEKVEVGLETFQVVDDDVEKDEDEVGCGKR